MQAKTPQDIDIEVNLYAKGVMEWTVRPVAFGACPLEESPTGQVAARIINALDKTGYSKEQVHAICQWALYLSTQD